MIDLDIPEAFQELFVPARYKVFYGGRGGAKSWAIARALVAIAYTRKVRILCAREFQTSIADSVYQLLIDQISAMNLAPFFYVTKTSIRSLTTGAEFLFKGIRHNVQEIKSTEGIDICWVEEALLVTDYSWEVLIPTIRKQGSEIWVSFNPGEEDAPTHERFVVKPPPDAIVRKVSWADNPWFPETLDKERRHMLATDPEAHAHVWEGECRTISNAIIFRGRYAIESFQEPERVDRYFYGADWGFANDPTALVRSYIADNTLYVTHEAFGYGVEFEELPALFDSVPDSRKWPIKADSARPETISFMRRQGFNIAPADKWKGSVEDGIAHLKGFRRIVIHERCKHVIQEARLYAYKIDRVTQEVLPIIVDKHNHGWDAIRYSLDGYIQNRGGVGVWAKLAGKK